MTRDELIARRLDGYEPEIGAALWRLEDARRRTLRLLEGVSPVMLDTAVPGNSIGTVLYHVALIEADWLYSDILEQPLPDELAALFTADHRDAAGILSAIRGQSLEQHLDRLAAVRSELLARLRGMTADEFRRARSLPNYEVSPAWVLHHLAQHEAEHRGEIGSTITLLADAHEGDRV